MEKKYVANKAFIVNQAGKVLMLRDAGKGDHVKAKGKLGFPGGRMDRGETPQEGLLRELKEEIGVDETELNIGPPIHVGIWGIGGDVLDKPIIGIHYLCRPRGELTITLSDEHDEIVWVDPRQTLPEEQTDHDLRALLEAYRAHEGIVVAADAAIKGRQGYGLIQLFTGNGKGKTTASMGEAIRAVGAGKKVGMVFFDKGGNDHYFERLVLEKLEGVDFVATGRDRIHPSTGAFDFSIQDLDLKEAQRGLEEVHRMFTEGYDLVIMDEINSTTDLGMISVESVLAALDKKPEGTELIMTGRNAPQEFLDRAHLVSEMKLRKHYFYSGVKAREGLDY